MQHYQTFGMLGIFLFCFFFCRHLLSDFIITFKNSIRITIRVSNSFAGLICVPKCLQRLSADDQSWHKKERQQAIQGYMYMGYMYMLER